MEGEKKITMEKLKQSPVVFSDAQMQKFITGAQKWKSEKKPKIEMTHSTTCPSSHYCIIHTNQCFCEKCGCPQCRLEGWDETTPYYKNPKKKVWRHFANN